jgi:hypothetical protein
MPGSTKYQNRKACLAREFLSGHFRITAGLFDFDGRFTGVLDEKTIPFDLLKTNY